MSEGRVTEVVPQARCLTGGDVDAAEHADRLGRYSSLAGVDFTSDAFRDLAGNQRDLVGVGFARMQPRSEKGRRGDLGHAGESPEGAGVGNSATISLSFGTAIEGLARDRRAARTAVAQVKLVLSVPRPIRKRQQVFTRL